MWTGVRQCMAVHGACMHAWPERVDRMNAPCMPWHSLLGEVLQVALGHGDLSGDNNLGLVTANLDVVAQDASLAANLDLLGQELLKGSNLRMKGNVAQIQTAAAAKRGAARVRRAVQVHARKPMHPCTLHITTHG